MITDKTTKSRLTHSDSMADLETSSVVGSILAAFQNGMDVFVRMRRKKPKRNGKPPRMTQDELRLHDSLSNRPKDIQTEYISSVSKHGQRFVHGDDAAYSSLAHTLLVLNTGLIGLINNALCSDAVDRSTSYQNLLMLSESASANTIQALCQLNDRLSVAHRKRRVQGQERVANKFSKRNSEAIQKMEPLPSPLLARGGWIRTKSGWAVVSATSAKKLTAQINANQRSKASPRSSRTALENPDVLLIDTMRGYDDTSTSTTRYLPLLPESECEGSTPSTTTLNDERPPSMLLVPATYFHGHETCRQDSEPPPRPPKIPLHARLVTTSRARPLSAATFMTTSTKIGEIPEHKQEDWLSPEERGHLPLPYVIPPPLESPKRQRKGLKFWKSSKVDGIDR